MITMHDGKGELELRLEKKKYIKKTKSLDQSGDTV